MWKNYWKHNQQYWVSILKQNQIFVHQNFELGGGNSFDFRPDRNATTPAPTPTDPATIERISSIVSMFTYGG